MKIIGKLNDEIKNLKRKVASSEDTMGRLREEKIRYMSDTEELRR